MGYGTWTRVDFERYNRTVGRAVNASGNIDARYTDSQIFTQKILHPTLNPRNVVRECCDSKDHPNSKPVILALDVTGSMGPASAEVAKKMNEVMTKLYDTITDVEFMVMGIGDLAYDRAPIQISQFESDIRIAEQLDHVYMEHGGGGNAFESYTAAWYMGARHTKLDCLKRGRKALIITMGDEPLNPYLPHTPLAAATGDELEADIETNQLYDEATEMFDIYHLHVNHRQNDYHWPRVLNTFGQILPEGHLLNVTIDEIADAIIRIITEHVKKNEGNAVMPAQEMISWDTEPENTVAEPERKTEKRGLFGIFKW